MTANATKSPGPPAAADPETLWAKITQLPRATTDLAFPRRHPTTGEMFEQTVKLWVLTEAELMGARAAAEKFAKELLSDGDLATSGHLGYADIYRNELVVELMCRAVRSDNVAIPFFPSPKAARQYVTSDEWTVLFNAYCDFQLESGPILAHMDEATMNAWVEKLMEGARRSPLARLSSAQRDALLMHTASLLRQSLTGSGSLGEPLSEWSKRLAQSQDSTTSSEPLSTETALGEHEAPPEDEGDDPEGFVG
jgi:hypothetical protein